MNGRSEPVGWWVCLEVEQIISARHDHQGRRFLTERYSSSNLQGSQGFCRRWPMRQPQWRSRQDLCLFLFACFLFFFQKKKKKRKKGKKKKARLGVQVAPSYPVLQSHQAPSRPVSHVIRSDRDLWNTAWLQQRKKKKKKKQQQTIHSFLSGCFFFQSY